MARLPLINEEDHPELASTVEQIKCARGGELLNIYKVLLHSPVIAEAWLDFANTVRWKTSTDGGLRELIILRVGLLNRSDYVVRQHRPRYGLAEGLTIEQMEAVGDWQNSALFTAPQRAALAYADAMTREVQVPSVVFDELRQHFDERAVVDLTMLVGSYNALTRVLSALEVDLQPVPNGGA